ncbi:MAG: shikimate kinase [Muribaculaceae bacterium]|nr:shikimate kinase [Muribaculaceae bacterium]
MTIFLIGYMASGKTTLGRAFAKANGLQFIDLDFYIEQRFRKSISQIFAEEGEERFRQIERAMLREVGEFCDAVISCGGGTPCFFDNMDYMNSQGITVWLDADIPTTTRRLLEAKGKRPIVMKLTPEQLPSFIETHLAARRPHYSKAHIRLDSNLLESRHQIAQTIQTLQSIIDNQ